MLELQPQVLTPEGPCPETVLGESSGCHCRASPTMNRAGPGTSVLLDSSLSPQRQRVPYMYPQCRLGLPLVLRLCQCWTWLELVLEAGWAGERLGCVPEDVGARHAGAGSERLSRTEPAASTVAPGAGAAVCARAAVEGGDGWACCFIPELVFRGWPMADASLGDALSECLEDS